MTAIDFPNSPTTNQTFTAGGVTWRYDGSKWGLDGYASGPTYETALPGSPVDGQEIYYAADATNGIIWHLRYRSAARSGSGAWEFLGGASLTSEVTTNQTRSNAAYGDLTTTGPSIALPLKGDYTVRIAALMYVTSATSAQVDAFMSYQIGSTGASNNDAAIVGAWGGYSSTVQAVIYTATRERTKTGLDAVTLTAKYKTSNTNGTGNFSERVMKVTPIRVWA